MTEISAKSLDPDDYMTVYEENLSLVCLPKLYGDLTCFN